MDMGAWSIKDKKFWFMFGVFVFFLGLYVLDEYVLRMFSVNGIDSFRILMGLWGLAFGFYGVYAHGYMEGLKDGEKTESNKTESE